MPLAREKVQGKGKNIGKAKTNKDLSQSLKSLIADENQAYLDSISPSGVLTFASRLKRLEELLFSQAQELYKSRGLDFKPMWFPFLLSLRENIDGLDIQSLSEIRRTTHSSASQIVKELALKKLVKLERSSTDQRQKRVKITPKGQELMSDLVPSLKLIESGLLTAFGEEKNTIIPLLTRIEESFRQKPFVKRRLDISSEIEIVSYKPKYAQSFEDLNTAWLEKFDFEVEDIDKKLMNKPEESIINKGGAIFFALYKGLVIGTVALIKVNDENIELAKMAVHEHFQGHGVGHLLMDKCIEFARKEKYSEIVIVSDRKLDVALGLYRKYGFVELTEPVLKHYNRRGDIWFSKAL